MAEVMVWEELGRISLYELDGDINKAVEVLRRWQELHKDKKLQLDLRSQEYDDGKEYAIIWIRPENEQEKNKRLVEEEDNHLLHRVLVDYILHPHNHLADSHKVKFRHSL